MAWQPPPRPALPCPAKMSVLVTAAAAALTLGARVVFFTLALQQGAAANETCDGAPGAPECPRANLPPQLLPPVQHAGIDAGFALSMCAGALFVGVAAYSLVHVAVLRRGGGASSSAWGKFRLRHRASNQVHEFVPHAAALHLSRPTKCSRARDELPQPQQQEQDQILFVDCTHPSQPCLTHHRLPLGNQFPPPAAVVADTSTEMCIKARLCQLSLPTRVTSDHFDIDSLCALLVLLEPVSFARDARATLVAVAEIGDFRAFDPSSEAHQHALKICCLINEMEHSRFGRAFEGQDDRKLAYFVLHPEVRDLLRGILLHPHEELPAYESLWAAEYNRVLADLEKLQDPALTSVRVHGDLSLAVVRTAAPVHYYALFAKPVIGDADLVLSVYAGCRFELEDRYTRYVQLCSRKVLPRPNLRLLARRLNALSGSEAPPQGCEWSATRFNEPGPILRLEAVQAPPLSKAQRYGSPFERSGAILPHPGLCAERMEALVVEHLRGFLAQCVECLEARVSTPSSSAVELWRYGAKWSWADLHFVNDAKRSLRVVV